MPVETVSTSELAKLIDVVPRTVQQLTSDGIIARAVDKDGNEILGRYNLLAVADYVRYLRTMARLDDTSESKKTELQNQKLAAEAEMAALRLAQFKGQMHAASDVEFVMTNMLTFFKQRVLAIPSRISRQLVGKTKFQEIYDQLMGEIVGCLRELSGYDPTMFADKTAARITDGTSLIGNGKHDHKTDGADGPAGEGTDWITPGPIED